jgi:hypothetical protein
MKYISLLAFLRVDLTCCDVFGPQSTAGLVECRNQERKLFQLLAWSSSGIWKSDYVDNVTHFVKSSTEEYRACERERLISQNFMNSYHKCVRRCYITGDLCNNSAMQRCKLKYRASFGHGFK